jgi:hypothetical protein
MRDNEAKYIKSKIAAAGASPEVIASAVSSYLLAHPVDVTSKVDKETGKALYPDADALKLAGIEAGANNYTHPANHSASVITQDASNRFVSDTEKSTWNGKAESDHTHTGVYEPANSNIQTHVTSTHAPSTAQKNSDILQSEIEAKLTGVITTHSHAYTGYAINVQALTSSPVDAQTIYFGTLPKAPVTAAGTSKIYVRKAGTIKIAEIYCYSGTAGTNENWSLYVRKNNSADTLIATVGAAANERVFSNTSLSIAVAAGDYIEIKGVNPTWATNPATTIFGGYIYIE